MSQINIKEMNNQQLGDKKFNNGCLELIQRHPEMRHGYIKATQKELEKMPDARQYGRFMIGKVLNDQVPLNPSNRVIKTAFLTVYDDLYPGERLAAKVSEPELVEA
jgi:hypothetical protein